MSPRLPSLGGGRIQTMSLLSRELMSSFGGNLKLVASSEVQGFIVYFTIGSPASKFNTLPTKC